MSNDTIFGIRHGVLYEAYPSSVSSNTNPQRQYDQNYGQFLMVSVPEDDEGKFAGQHWMIDTYHFTSPSVCVREGQTRGEAIVEQAATREFVSSGALWSLKGNCYYNASVRLTEDNAGLFSEVCDLREWEPVSESEAPDYDVADIRHGIHLYQEQGYSWGRGDIGITLRRKGAPKSLVRQAKAIVARMERERPYYMAFSYDREAADLEKFAYGHRDNRAVMAVLEGKVEEIGFVRDTARAWRELVGRVSSYQMSLFSFDEEGNIMVGDADGH